MPFITKLKNGDIVEIETGEKETIFQEEWLKEVKTAKAKTRMVKILNTNKKDIIKEKVFKIIATDRKNLALEVTDIFTKNKINIENLEANVIEKSANIKVTIQAKTNDDLESIVERLENIKDVKAVRIDI